MGKSPKILIAAWMVWIAFPIAAIFLLSCGEQTAQYKRSYVEFERGNYQEVSLMGTLPWCDDACKLRAKAAEGILLVNSNGDPYRAYTDLRSAVLNPMFAGYIPSNQQQKVFDAFCKASYRNLKASSGQNLIQPNAIEQVETDCRRASSDVRKEVNRALSESYGQAIPGMIQQGHITEARKAITAYEMLPGANTEESSQWEEQLAKISPGATYAAPVWLLVRAHTADSPQLIGQPGPVVLGVYKDHNACERAKAQHDSRTAGNSDVHSAAQSREPVCISSSDHIWGNDQRGTLWLLFQGERWNAETMSLSCKPREEIARGRSWGVYTSARSCEQARHELFGESPCALCLPATAPEVVQD